MASLMIHNHDLRFVAGLSLREFQILEIMKWLLLGRLVVPRLSREWVSSYRESYAFWIRPP